MFSHKFMRGILAIQIVGALIFSLFSPVAPAYANDNQNGNSNCPQTGEWVKIDSKSGYKSDNWGNISWGGEDGKQFKYDLNNGYAMDICVKSGVNAFDPQGPCKIDPNNDMVCFYNGAHGKGSISGINKDISHISYRVYETGTITVEKQFCYFNNEFTNNCEKAVAPTGAKVEFKYYDDSSKQLHKVDLDDFDQNGYDKSKGTKPYSGEITVCEDNFADFLGVAPIPGQGQTASGTDLNCITGTITPSQVNTYTFYNFISRPRDVSGNITVVKKFCSNEFPVGGSWDHNCVVDTSQNPNSVDFSFKFNSEPSQAFRINNFVNGVGSFTLNNLDPGSYEVCEHEAGDWTSVVFDASASTHGCITIVLGENGQESFTVHNFAKPQDEPETGELIIGKAFCITLPVFAPLFNVNNVQKPENEFHELFYGLDDALTEASCDDVAVKDVYFKVHRGADQTGEVVWNAEIKAEDFNELYGYVANSNLKAGEVYTVCEQATDGYTVYNGELSSVLYGGPIKQSECITVKLSSDESVTVGFANIPAKDETPETPVEPEEPVIPTPTPTPTPGQVLGEQIEQPEVLAAITQLPSTGVQAGGINLIMAMFLGAILTRRRIG